MKFWQKLSSALRNKKIILGVLTMAIVFVVGLIPFHEARAWSPFSLQNITSNVIGFGASVMGYIFGWITSVVFWFGGLLVELALNINLKLLSETNAVLHTGWQIVLSFANLGFVLAIIIIAFATIFRMQSYAMKQVLWKLIVAALLVNFSLVIAGAFISVSDNLSEVFLAKVTLKGEGNFTAAMVNVLGVQSFLKTKDMLSGKETDAKQKIIEATNVFGGAMLTMIASIFFIAFFTFLGGLTLLAIAIMLIIRYVVLSILLILSPLAWLCWILPGTSNLWQKWWDNFLRWTFFTPIVLFFLYLPIATMIKMREYTKTLIAKEAGDVGSVFAPESNPLTFGIDNILNLVVVLGLMIGGLIVANSLSITGASTAMGFAKGAGKWAQGAVGRKGLQLGTAPLRAKWFGKEGEKKSVGEKAVEWASKTGWVGRHTLGYAARGITRLETAGGENVLKEHAKAAGNMSDADLKASVLTVSGPRKIAVAKELQKRKLLGDVDAKNLITEGNQSLFGRFRQGVSWGDVQHGAKMDTKMAKEIRETGRASLGSVKEFVKTYKGKDIEQSVIKDLYSGKAKLGLSRDSISELGLTFAEALATENYQVVPKIIPTMDARERNNFSGSYEHALGGAGIDQRVRDAWTNTMNNYAMGFSAEAPTTGTTPPPPTA